jgi:hypothetical protein
MRGRVWRRSGAIAGLLQVAVLAAPVDYFESNRFGLQRAPIAWYRIDDHEFVLAVDTFAESEASGLQSRRVLLSDDVELREWRVWLEAGERVEAELLAGVVELEQRYDAVGRLTEERRFAASGALFEVDRWSYRDGKSAAMVTRDAAGARVSSREYALATNGRLRSVAFDGPAAGSMSLVLRDGRLVEERITEADAQLVSRYRDDGSRYALEQWRGDEQISSARWEYDAAGVARGQTTVDLEDGTATTALHDARGRVVVERRWQGTSPADPAAELLEEHFLTWGDADELVEERRVSDVGVELWEYAFDADGERTRERYSRRGTLIRTTAYTGGDERVDTLFRSGAPALRVFWSGDERVGDELIDDAGTVGE